MSATVLFLSVVGATVSLLLSVIAYFLKLLIEDFRRMSTELSRLKESVIRLESEQVVIKSLLEKYRGQLRSMRSQ
jgi:hypothetical protein